MAFCTQMPFCTVYVFVTKHDTILLITAISKITFFQLPALYFLFTRLTMIHNVIERMFGHLRPVKFRTACASAQSDKNLHWAYFWMAIGAMFLHADNKDSDQTAQMRRLIRVFDLHTCQKVRFLTLQLKSYNFAGYNITEGKHAFRRTVAVRSFSVSWLWKKGVPLLAFPTLYFKYLPVFSYAKKMVTVTTQKIWTDRPEQTL